LASVESYTNEDTDIDQDMTPVDTYDINS